MDNLKELHEKNKLGHILNEEFFIYLQMYPDLSVREVELLWKMRKQRPQQPSGLAPYIPYPYYPATPDTGTGQEYYYFSTYYNNDGGTTINYTI